MLISKVKHSSLFQKRVVIVATAVALFNLYSLDLVGHNHRVLFTDLGGSFSLVIIGTVVLVGVPVDATEKVSAATVKSWKQKGQVSKLVHERKRLYKPGYSKPWKFPPQQLLQSTQLRITDGSPVRPTLLRHMKHRFFLGLELSPLLSSVLEDATGVGLEAAGWLTTAGKNVNYTMFNFTLLAD